MLFGGLTDNDWRETTYDGKTALHLAAAAADGPSVLLLLQHTAIDPCQLDFDGFSAMFYAISSDCSDCIAAILQHVPSCLFSLSNHNTYRNVGALELAMRVGSESIVQLLLDKRLARWNDTMSNEMVSCCFIGYFLIFVDRSALRLRIC